MAADTSKSDVASESAVVVRAVTVIIGVVVGLTFLFGFGNVLSLALRLGLRGLRRWSRLPLTSVW